MESEGSECDEPKNPSNSDVVVVTNVIDLPQPKEEFVLQVNFIFCYFPLFQNIIRKENFERCVERNFAKPRCLVSNNISLKWSMVLVHFKSHERNL